MTKPKMSTKTPDATESNALIDAHADIIAMPRERRIIIAEIITREVSTNVATGNQQATLQLAHIEIPVGHDRAAAEKILDAAFKGRTGLKHRPDPSAGDGDTPLEGLADAGLDDSVTAGE